MQRSRRLFLSLIFASSNSTFFISGTLGKEGYSRPFIDCSKYKSRECYCCFHGKLMPGVVASRPRVREQKGRWAHCELAQSHIGLLPVSACVSVHGFHSTFTEYCLSCSDLLFLCCFAWWWLLGFFILFLCFFLFSSPAANRSWATGLLLYTKHVCL